MTMERKLRFRNETTFYVSDVGHVCIHQPGEHGGDTVDFDRTDIPQVIEWLKELAQDAIGVERQVREEQETEEEARLSKSKYASDLPIVNVDTPVGGSLGKVPPSSNGSLG